MRPEDVPADLLELAAGVSWEQGRWPGWPTWEEFSRRADENLYDCKELRATHVRLTAEMLAAVLPMVQTSVLDGARKQLQVAYKAGPGNNLQGRVETWRKGMSRAHRIVRDYQESLTTAAVEPAKADLRIGAGHRDSPEAP